MYAAISFFVALPFALLGWAASIASAVGCIYFLSHLDPVATFGCIALGLAARLSIGIADSVNKWAARHAVEAAE